MTLSKKMSEEVECLRCGFYGATVIYLVELDAEYMFCNCGVFRVLETQSRDNWISAAEFNHNHERTYSRKGNQ